MLRGCFLRGCQYFILLFFGESKFFCGTAWNKCLIKLKSILMMMNKRCYRWGYLFFYFHTKTMVFRVRFLNFLLYSIFFIRNDKSYQIDWWCFPFIFFVSSKNSFTLFSIEPDIFFFLLWNIMCVTELPILYSGCGSLDGNINMIMYYELE